MKTHLRLLIISLAAMISSAQAETPAQIAADYRAKAEPALAKVNDTLEKAVVPILADLVKAGDTAGAEEVKQQLKAKQAGEAIVKPHAKVENLFKLYDAARVKALEPAQKDAVARIEALLRSSDGKKLEVVEELGKVRAEIESGKIIDPKSIPEQWTYHQTPDGKPDAQIKLFPDGVFQIDDGGEVQTGTWKPKKQGFVITLNRNTWNVVVKDGLGTIEREVGTRYMRPVVTSK